MECMRVRLACRCCWAGCATRQLYCTHPTLALSTRLPGCHKAHESVWLLPVRAPLPCPSLPLLAGGHVFQAGFPFAKRVVNLLYKGSVFALIGLFAGVVGTSVSNGLIALRKKIDPTWSTPVRV